MLKAMRRVIMVAVLASFYGISVGGEPVSAASIQLVGHVNYCVAPDQYDFSQSYFLPVKFRPIAATVPGLDKCEMSLDGKWRIHPTTPPDGFQNAEAGEGWSDFTVPGQWRQQGFDRAPDDWWVPRETPMDNVVGMMKEFDAPKSWAGKRIILRFEAIHSGVTYWLNGKKLGYSENLFTPVEFDVTDSVSFDKTNRLALSMKVKTESENASFSSGYAFHNLGGIDRSVHLFALPTTYISRLHYTTPLDEQYRNATLSLDISVDNPTDKSVSGLSLVMTLTSPDGQSVKLEQSKFDLPAVEPGESRFSPKLSVINPAKWSDEKPNLYKLTVELQQDGKAAERVEQAVGFRQIEIKNKQLCINGRGVKLRGVLRHEVNPLSGRADTAQFGEPDVKLFKYSNFNYVRTIHYPATRQFLDACNRLGMYVESEAPFCWTQLYQSDDPKLAKHFLTAAAAMLEYNRNDPAVISWSIVNESPVGCCLLETLKLLRKEDTSRLAVSNGDVVPDCQLMTWHYPAFPFEVGSGFDVEPRPTSFDEYIPLMMLYYPEEYDLNPGLNTTWSEGQNSPSSYISQVYASRHVIGGAICAVGDEEFYFADKSVKGYGCWGFFDVWRRKKSISWDAKLMHSPVWIPVREIVFKPGQKDVKIPIENRYSFTDLGELACTWELGCSSGKLPMSLPPRSEGELEIALPAGAEPGQKLILRFADDKGELVSAHVVKLVASTTKRTPYFEISPTSRPAERTIKMDGTFDDWKDMEPVTKGEHAETVGDGREGNDIEAVWMAADADNLYISIKCNGPITTKVQWALTSLLIDADENEFTGFAAQHLGVEYLVQPVAEARTDMTFLRRRDGQNNTAWGGWERPPVTVENTYFIGKGADNNRVEMCIPWGKIGVKNPAEAKLRFRIVDGSVFLNEGKGDWVPDAHPRFIPPVPKGGCPKWTDDADVLTVEGDNFRMAINKATGKIEQGDGGEKPSVPLLEMPSPYFSLAGEMNMRSLARPGGIPFAEYADTTTRKVESITAQQRGDALAIKIQESYKDFNGSCELLIDKTGLAVLSFDYTYSGSSFSIGETGLQMLFDKKCRQISWERDTEWDIYPDDNIGRPKGTACADMPEKWRDTAGMTPYLAKPTWPWELDANRFGTRDFRSSKYHIYSASLLAPDGSGINVASNGTTTDVRANLAANGVVFHILNGHKPARVLSGGLCYRYFDQMWAGCKVTGSFSIKLLAPSGEPGTE